MTRWSPATDEPAFQRPRRIIRILATVGVLFGMFLLALHLTVWAHFELSKQRLNAAETYQWDNGSVFLQQADTTHAIARCTVRTNSQRTQVDIFNDGDHLIAGQTITPHEAGVASTIDCDTAVNISGGSLVGFYKWTHSGDLYSGALLTAIGAFVLWRFNRPTARAVHRLP